MANIDESWYCEYCGRDKARRREDEKTREDPSLKKNRKCAERYISDTTPVYTRGTSTASCESEKLAARRFALPETHLSLPHWHWDECSLDVLALSLSL